MLLGLPETDAASDQYACPLCLEINHEERRAQFRVFTEAALTDGSLTVEHVPAGALWSYRAGLATVPRVLDWMPMRAGVKIRATHSWAA